MAHRPSTLLGIITLSIATGSLLFFGALLSGATLIQSLALGATPLLPMLLIASPFTLLEFLLIVRPSLDRLSEFFVFPVPFTQDLTLTLAQAFGAVVVVLGIAFFLRFRKVLFHTPLSLPFLVLLASGAITLSYSIEPQSTLYEMFRLFSIFFIFALAYHVVDTERRFLRLLIVVLLSCVVPIASAWVQFFLGIGYTDSEFSVPRIFGTFTHPNILALYLIVAAAAAIILLTYFKTKPARLLTGMTLGITLVTLIFTYARAAWGTFFIFAGLVALFKYPKILPLLIIIPLFAFFASPAIQDRVEDALEYNPTGSLAWRVTLWDDMMTKTFQDERQWYGYGMGSFESAAEDLRGLRFTVNDPHNEFVRSFVEGGYPGLAIFLFFSIAPLWILFVRRRELTGDQQFIERGKTTLLFLLCLLTALLILSFTDHVLRSTMVQWILFAMVGGALRVYGRK